MELYKPTIDALESAKGRLEKALRDAEDMKSQSKEMEQEANDDEKKGREVNVGTIERANERLEKTLNAANLKREQAKELFRLHDAQIASLENEIDQITKLINQTKQAAKD